MAQQAEAPDLVDRMLKKDRAAFREALALCGPAMLRAARAILKNEASAEETVQDAWLSILKALPAFERRSSLRTWAVTITINRARTRLGHDARVVLAGTEEDAQLYGEGAFKDNGWWAEHPAWMKDGVQRLQERELLECVHEALAQMPPLQAAVLTLHDLEQAEPTQICNALEITESNQRVLLHRARARVRKAWLDKLADKGGPR